MPQRPLFEYQGLDLCFTVWPGYVEVTEGASATRVALASITEVERSAWNAELSLHTAEGRIYTCALPAEQIEGVQAALARAMKRPGGAPGAAVD